MNRPTKASRGVGFNYARPMSSQETPQEEEGFFKAPGSDIVGADRFLQERGIGALGGLSALIQGMPAPTRQPSDTRFGTLPWFLREGIPGGLESGTRFGIDRVEDLVRWAGGAEGLPEPERRVSSYLFPRTSTTGPEFFDGFDGGSERARNRRGLSAADRNRLQRERGAQTGAAMSGQMGEEPAATDWLAEAMGILGGGPDYSAYRASLEDMVLNPETGLSPRLQAMYNQLAEQAGANQQRIADIYGGATENVGSAYDTSAANVSDAFTSAQQQAADQMARLGIGEAAGQVIPQAAGRQASALAGLEQGRAGGLSALERYGASSGDFASQMGQAAQQRGVEQNEFLLGALQRQLAESLGMEAQGAYDARLRAPGLARDLFEASQLGQPQGPTFEQQLAADRFAFDQGKTAADMQVEAQQNRNRRYQELFTFYNGNAQKAQEQVLFEIEQGLI
jgi:hypothetical protein